MSAYLIIGLPHHGKSLESAKQMRKLLRRNIRWYKKQVKKWNNNKKYKINWTGEEPKKRLVYANLKVSEKWLNNKRHELAQSFIRYWDDPMELIDVHDADIIWDEIARALDSRDWANLSPKLKKFIQEHDKVGVDIYANTQSPMQVDVMFRRNCEKIWRVTKLMGSARPSPTKPPTRFIWGICFLRELERVSFGKEEDQEQFKAPFFTLFYFFNLRWIDRATCEFFDTRWRIKGHYPPFEHIERSCVDPNCTFHKVLHG